MSMYLVLAWRNLWRNKFRTLITISSILFAVILVLFTRSMQLGTYEHLITSTLSIYTGFLQIQAEDYWDERSLENSMEFSDSLFKKVNSFPHITSVVPRIETFALASSGENTRGVTVTGINPQIENHMSKLSQKITAGQYINPGSMDLMVASKLAGQLKIVPGDSLVLLTQGYHGTNAAGLFAVSAIVELPVPDLNETMIYMTIDAAQYLLYMSGRVTSVAIMIDDPDKMSTVQSTLSDSIRGHYEIMNWRELLPELVQSIEIDSAGGLIMIAILYVVIGFGIFGTVMMMTEERKLEFAIIHSVGMKKWRMQLMVIIETGIISLAGAIFGCLLSIPLLLYMRANPIRLSGTAAEAMLQYGFEPIIPFLVEISLFVNQIAIIFLIASIACIYPVWAISKMKISKALHI